jgi:hypothetical protein
MQDWRQSERYRHAHEDPTPHTGAHTNATWQLHPSPPLRWSDCTSYTPSYSTERCQDTGGLENGNRFSGDITNEADKRGEQDPLQHPSTSTSHRALRARWYAQTDLQTHHGCERYHCGARTAVYAQHQSISANGADRAQHCGWLPASKPRVVARW